MNWKLLVPTFLLAVLAGCGPDGSPTASTDDLSSEGAYYAAKPASHDRAMRDFQRANDKVWETLRDIKRYIQKDPNVDRHADKVRKLSKDLNSSFRQLGEAFKKVRYDPAAQAAMKSLAEYAGSVIARLGRYNLSYAFIINPCVLPWIGEYLCQYAPGEGRSL